MRADLFADQDESSWDPLVAASPQGTLFHQRAFLAYHGARFQISERSVVWREGEETVGVMPMAVMQSEGRTIARSPFGGSVGGPVFFERPRYRRCAAAAAALVELLVRLGVDEMQLTLPPSVWHQEPDDTMLLALLEQGWVSTGRDVHSIVPLIGFSGFAAGSRVGRSVRRASAGGVTIERDAPLDAFAAVLDATFRKHGTSPTHSHEELAWLRRALPSAIRVHVARLGSEPVAGMAEFVVAHRVVQSFYLAQDPAHQDTQALSLLVADALTQAAADGFASYDFGTSSVEQRARVGVLEFKESFGATTHCRERLTWRPVARPPG